MENDYKKAIGNRIKLFRERNNMSQEELAKKLGYSSKASISNIEVGKANIPSEKMFDFAKALNCAVDDLIGTLDDEIEQTRYNAAEIVSQMSSMQNILKMLSTMDTEKIQQIEKIIKTFVEE